MLGEMQEQPDVMAGLLQRRPEITRQVRALVPQDLAGVMIVARGSSDNAAVFGRYVLQVASRRPVSLAAPSLHTIYQTDVDASGYLCIAISQSGGTREVVEVLGALREAGGTTIAITNDTEDSFGSAAQMTLRLDAGPELAVPATKTLTASLLGLALLAEGIGDAPWKIADIDALPRAAAVVLQEQGPVDDAVGSMGDATSIVVTGRGYVYAAALETALKLRETSGLLAEGYSGADLRHGPLAAVGEATPAVIMWAGANGSKDARELADVMRKRGSRVISVSDEVGSDLVIPQSAEALAPISLVVRGQQLAHALTLSRGLDPDAPEGLTKVTRT